VNSGLTDTWVSALAVVGAELFAGRRSVFCSTDNGTSWQAASDGLPFIASITAFAVIGTNLFASTYGQGVFLTTDNGASWAAVNSGIPDQYVLTLAVSGTNLFAGGYGGVSLSTNNGATWDTVNTGMGFSVVNALAVSPAVGGRNAYIFAGRYDGVWGHPISEITKVEKNSTLPTTYSLHQNYPNPFNPSTTISYDMPARSHVTLKIFNVLGQEVATFVCGEVEAGRHQVQWDAGHLSSGVFFYRLQAGKFVENRKMILLK
jgi:hypothetical protein